MARIHYVGCRNRRSRILVYVREEAVGFRRSGGGDFPRGGFPRESEKGGSPAAGPPRQLPPRRVPSAVSPDSWETAVSPAAGFIAAASPKGPVKRRNQHYTRGNRNTGRTKRNRRRKKQRRSAGRNFSGVSDDIVRNRPQIHEVRNSAQSHQLGGGSLNFGRPGGIPLSPPHPFTAGRRVGYPP